MPLALRWCQRLLHLALAFAAQPGLPGLPADTIDRMIIK